MSGTLGTRKLGTQGLVSSAQGLGCMSLTEGFYAREAGFDDQSSIEVLKKAFDLGVTLLSTAAFYGPNSENETLIGKAIKGVPREKVVIASKWGPDMKEGGKLSFDVSRETAHRVIDQQLQRLGVDYLDVWVLRSQGTGDWLEEGIKAMAEVVKTGKVKYMGVSEMSADMIRRAHAIHPVSLLEMEWSLFSRDAEADLVPTCRELGIGILAYSPMSRGILSGAFTKPEDLPENDFRRHNPRFQQDALAKNLELANKVKALADKRGCTAGQLALAWVQAQGDDVVPIPGTKRVKYLEQNVAAASIKLTAAELKELEEAVPFSEVAGDRYAIGHGATYRG